MKYDFILKIRLCQHYSSIIIFSTNAENAKYDEILLHIGKLGTYSTTEFIGSLTPGDASIDPIYPPHTEGSTVNDLG